MLLHSESFLMCTGRLFWKITFLLSSADRQIAWGVDIPRDWLPFFLLLNILVTSSADSVGTKIERGFSRSTLGRSYLSVVCAGCCISEAGAGLGAEGPASTTTQWPYSLGNRLCLAGSRCQTISAKLQEGKPVSQLVSFYLPAHRSKQEYGTCLYFL